MLKRDPPECKIKVRQLIKYHDKSFAFNTILETMVQLWSDKTHIEMKGSNDYNV